MSLPIDDLINRLIPTLSTCQQVLVQAPPGAGKSTQIPLHLLKGWSGNGKIIMLEPRRIAARNLAEFIAKQCDEPVGRSVGYRIRQDSSVSVDTRLEIVTEGVLTRMLQTDPMLDGVDIIIFDEFHERHLQSDLALALCLDCQHGLRDDLKIIIMSATLDTLAIEKLLPAAKVLETQGRNFPVELHYQPRPSKYELIDCMVACIELALARHSANILCFLPGKGEINRCLQQLSAKIPDDVIIAPLFGDLTMDRQRLAIAPPPIGKRKVVLATNIAETSLTIEGIAIVIDSGLERRAEFQPGIQMDRLITRFISKASATQRAGRAGRLMPGHCYRLWSHSQQESMVTSIPAEIETADLTAFALELAAWGATAEQLQWVTPPPSGRLTACQNILTNMQCLHLSQTITSYGRDVAAISAHPRFGHAMLQCQQFYPELLALCAVVIAMCEYRDTSRSDSADFAERVEHVIARPDKHGVIFTRARQLLRQVNGSIKGLGYSAQALTIVLAILFPDRLAKARGRGGFTLANAKGARFYGDDPLAQQAWLIIVDATTDGSDDMLIRRAMGVDIEAIVTALPNLVSQVEVACWQKQTGRFVAETQERIGAIIVQSHASESQVSDIQRSQGLVEYVRQQGLRCLTMSPMVMNFIHRCLLARRFLPDLAIPDMSESTLIAELETWLQPYLQPITHLSQLKKLPLLDILTARLEYNQLAQLNEHVPERMIVASGNRYRIDYLTNPEQPRLAVKLQEMFGQPTTPSIARGQCPVLIELLSPAGRPLQLTMDLTSFWQNGYLQVKKEMRGRYPKHPWPDDPVAALPTHKTKAKLAK